jgi:hypothetical protein
MLQISVKITFLTPHMPVSMFNQVDTILLKLEVKMLGLGISMMEHTTEYSMMVLLKKDMADQLMLK